MTNAKLSRRGKSSKQENSSCGLVGSNHSSKVMYDFEEKEKCLFIEAKYTYRKIK